MITAIAMAALACTQAMAVDTPCEGVLLPANEAAKALHAITVGIPTLKIQLEESEKILAIRLKEAAGIRTSLEKGLVAEKAAGKLEAEEAYKRGEKAGNYATVVTVLISVTAGIAAGAYVHSQY